MMKQYLIILVTMALMNMGCNAQKDSIISKVDAIGIKHQVDDSILQKLQADNDLIIAFAVENFAWVRSMDFHIITQKNNEWKGYIYHKNLMKNNAGSPTFFNSAVISNVMCDSALRFISENKAWTIPGDSDSGFCKDGNKNCNINDAASLRLLITTQKGVYSSSYYAPDFFEQCCPDPQRGLFVSIIKKIQGAFVEYPAEEQ